MFLHSSFRLRCYEQAARYTNLSEEVAEIWCLRGQARGLGQRYLLATRYRLDGPGIESQWEARPPSLLHRGCRVSTPKVKRTGRDVDHPTPSSAKINERVQLHLYYPSGPSWPLLR